MSAFDPKRTCAESFRCGAILGSDFIDCQLCPGTIYQAPGLHRVDRWRPVVANKAKYVDLFVALGNVGRVIEIFNPNRWMILARWAQIKLVGSKYRAHFPIMTLHPAANSIRFFAIWSKLKLLSFPPRMSFPPKMIWWQKRDATHARHCIRRPQL